MCHTGLFFKREITTMRPNLDIPGPSVSSVWHFSPPVALTKASHRPGTSLRGVVGGQPSGTLNEMQPIKMHNAASGKGCDADMEL